jgi:hypothetical protein
MMPPLTASAAEYFRTGGVVCTDCGNKADLWEVSLKYAKALRHGSGALTSLGAAQVSITIEMETDGYHEVDIAHHGAPQNARILSACYTSQGGRDGSVTALEWHGNSPSRRPIGTLLRLIGRPLGDGLLPRKGKVAIGVIYVREEDSDAWLYLVNAFESFSSRDYAPAMVFAQSAVEISMMPLIARRFERVSSVRRVKDFMRADLTYGHALNVVLPYFCRELDIPSMPEQILVSLNKLKKYRNSIIHEGKRSTAIAPEEVIEGITAAAFGFEFLRVVGPLLER